MAITRDPLEVALKMMAKTWGRGRTGYVFFPWITGSSKDKTERRKNYHEGPAFSWPKDIEKIKAHLQRRQKDDLYWCPSMFEKRQRIEPYAVPELALWADLDEVDPREISLDYQPTLAWESSPGRFQAIWTIQREVVGISWSGAENHRLTAYLGADPSGWDTTQLLRVPGWNNHKPEYRSKDGKPVSGRILWDRGPHYEIADFADLPEVQTLAIDESVIDEEIEAIDRHEVWDKIRLQVSKNVRDFMTAREATGDRSEVLWQIERDLADVGCTLSEIVAIVRPTVWNKFAGRNDELKRLRIEASKALHARPDDSEALEEIHEVKPDLELLTGSSWGTEPRPRWLVDEIWREGVCGFIAGDPKSYKSWIALDLAISIASGRPFLNLFAIKRPGPVILIEEEDRQSEVEARATAIFNDRAPYYHPRGLLTPKSGNVLWTPPTPLNLYKVIGKGFVASDPGWQGWLADQVRDTGAVMVIIDTLGTTAGEVDLDRGSEVLNNILTPLKRIAHRKDNECALAIIHHNKKSGDSTGGRRMLGSHHIYGWSEDALFFSPPDRGAVRIERSSKAARLSNLELKVPQMVNLDRGGAYWRPEVDAEDSKAITEGSRKGKKKKSKESTQKEPVAPSIVRKMVAAKLAPGQFKTTNEVAELLGMKQNSVYVQLHRYANKGWITRGEIEGLQVWALPSEG